jgi:hypothetical protein
VTLNIPDAVLRRKRRRDGGSGKATRREMLAEFWEVWEEHMVQICRDGAPEIPDEIEEGNE